MVSNSILYNKEPRFLGRWLILGLGQEIYTISLEHLIVPENRKVIKGILWRSSG